MAIEIFNGHTDRQQDVQHKPYWLFALFAMYGPSFTVFGEMRYVEAVLIAVFFVYIVEITRNTSILERRLIWLFVLAAFVQFISDLVNEAMIEGTLKRCGTYLIMAAILPTIRWLVQDDERRFIAIVAGYSASYIFIYFVGTSTSAAYNLVPWRLGLGMAATMFLTVLIAKYSFFWRFGAILLLLLTGFHLLEGARSLALIAAITAAFLQLGQKSKRLTPARFRVGFTASAAVLSFVFLAVIYQGMNWAVENNWLPEELQAKMEQQARSQYGLLAAARPDTITAIYAVSKRPLLGYGSTNVDPEVWDFYAEMASAYAEWDGNRDAIRSLNLDMTWDLGTPNHSHLFGAWADAGILAAICWLAILVFAIYILTRSLGWHFHLMPLAVLSATSLLWDVLFSPGPTRVDIAIKLVILMYVFAKMGSTYIREPDSEMAYKA